MSATIGLCMIVRDEAAVIERCLGSVDGLIDTWTICDTGSADETPDVIESALAGVPGRLHRAEWRDFGANRTELMELARGSADYLLLIDADMTVLQRGPLPELTADAYLIRHAGTLDYLIPRLVRGDLPWRYVGATHEYLTADGETSERVLPELVIEHHADSGTRAEKFERDARLLEAELEREPDNPRSTFYLAQTRSDLGDTEAAIDLYARRVALGGWDEEVFYAALQHGILVGRADPERGVELLDAAFELRPTRAEPLYEASRLLRYAGRHAEALERARRGLELPYPTDRLFVHRDVYEWGLRFELAVAAQMLGQAELALDATERLLVEGTLPGQHASVVAQNRELLLQGLEPDHPVRGLVLPQRLEALVPGAALGEVRLEIDPDWPQFNPSIARDGDGYRMIVRSANYRIRDGFYELLDAGEAVRTLNYMVELDDRLAVRTVAALADEATGPKRYAAEVLGFEDCRLFELGGRWWATATVRDRNPFQMCEIALLALDGGRIERVELLPGPRRARHEKNWMPFVRDGELLLVYSCAPAAVYSCDPATGTLAPVAGRPDPGLLSWLRGGSQGLAVEGGWLFVVHEVEAAGERRRYRHRFVRLDEGLRLDAWSPPFTFTGEPIELCAGLCRGDPGELVLSFGAGDRIAGLARCSEQAVLGLLGESLASAP